MLFSAFVQVLVPESSHHLRVVIIKIICKAETSGRSPFFEKVMKADFFSISRGRAEFIWYNVFEQMFW